MSRKRLRPLNPWQELEEGAYHAFREWPVFLKLRLRELRAHLPAEMFADFSPRRKHREEAAKAEEVAADIALLREYGLIVPETHPPVLGADEGSDA
jgi:hypothetical protein